MPNITLLCASADASFHALLRTALERDGRISLINDAGVSDRQILRIARGSRPDVFLLDGGFQAAALLLPRVHAASPATKAILFCDFCDRHQMVDALAHDAKGWVRKTAAPEQWLKAIRVIHGGDLWFDRKMLVEAMTGMLGQSRGKLQAAEPKPEGLTEREWEVVRWVGQGMTNKEIARQMAISDTTVKTHLQNIFGKLKVGRRLQLPAA